MTDWFRSWNGAPSDPKWGVVAEACGCKSVEVSGLVWALLDYASQNEDRGSIKGFPVRVFAHTSGLNAELINFILAELSADDIAVLADGRFKSWEKRQPKREDRSTERVKEHRKRNETQRNAPEQSRTEQNNTNVFVGLTDEWNAMAAGNGLASVSRLSDKRKTALGARVKDYGEDKIRSAIRSIPQYPFLLGDSKDGWKADFDFLLRPDSIMKIDEGKYAKADIRQSGRQPPASSEDQLEELRRRYGT